MQVSGVEDLFRTLVDATNPDDRLTALKDLRLRGLEGKPRNAREAVWVELVEREAKAKERNYGMHTHAPYMPGDDPYEPQWSGYATTARALLSDWGQEVIDHLLDAANRVDFMYPECIVKLLWGFADQLDEHAIEPLAALAESQIPQVAYYATCALINIESDQVVPVLARIAKASHSYKTHKIVGTESYAYDANEQWPVSKEVRVDNTRVREIAEAERKRRQKSQQGAPAPLDAAAAARQAAVEARDAGTLLDLLGEAFRDNDRKAADKTTTALKSLAASEPDVLIEGLTHETAEVRWVVAELLGDLGSRDAVPALTKALDDPDEGVREAASVALERLESG